MDSNQQEFPEWESELSKSIKVDGVIDLTDTNVLTNIEPMKRAKPNDILEYLKTKMEKHDDQYGIIKFEDKKSFGFYLYEISTDLHATYQSVRDSILKLVGKECINITVIGFDLKLDTANQILDYIEIHTQKEC